MSALALALGPPGILCAQPGPGSALVFDGTNGVVLQQQPVAPFANVTNTFTIEFWAKPSALRDASALEGDTGIAGQSGQRYVIFPDNGDTVYATGHAAVGVSVGINGVGVFARGNSYLPPLLSLNFSITNWIHVAVVVETNRPRLYLNGALVRTGVLSSRILHPSLTLGDPGFNYGHYAGALDEVRIWAGARSQAQLQAAMSTPLNGNEAGLQAYYRLDEGSGDTIADATAQGHTGQRFASATAYPQWTASTAPVGTPVLVTLAATLLRSSSAQLNGSVQPHGLQTTAWFQWGTTTNYGSVTPAVSASNGFSEVAIAQSISNLTPGITYHYRLAASNSVGIAYGTNAAFTAPYFDPIGAGLPQVGYGFGTWGDLNNDGRLDILLDGSSAGGATYHDVWANTTGGFVQLFQTMPWLQRGAVDLADINADTRLDTAFMGADVFNNSVTQVRTNTGSGFVAVGSVQPAQNGGLAWGDFDNDSRPDLVLVGYRSAGVGSVAEIWRNTGSTFTNINPGLTPGTLAAVAWGDFDNDGYLDLFESGAAPSFANFAEVWRNTGSGFTNINAGLPGVRSGSVAWGDYDNDGRLDIVYCGWLDGFADRITQVWRNTGSGFTNVNAGLPGVTESSLAWGDYDNDGRLDILLTGAHGSPPVRLAQIWRNTGGGFELAASGLTGIGNGNAAWGDYDNDGRLDVLLTGYTGSALICDVWHNVVPVTNTPPSAPTGLNALATTNGVALSWQPATDAQTPTSGLSYNLRVGTNPGTANVLAPNADLITGFRRVAKLGNAQMRTNALLRLPPGRYYWSVQAVDTAFAGGPWAAEQSFVVGAPRFTEVRAQPGGVRLTLLGYPGLAYTIRASTNLTAPLDQWSVLTNFTMGGSGLFEFTDAASLTLPRRFYRASTP